jgi:amino acid transporter
MTDEKLIRGISRWDLTAIAINTIIGTGIFLLPAKVTGLIGGYSLFAFVACAVIVAFIVLCFAEVSSRFQATGGMYLYAKEAFGSVVGFEVGWLYWIVRVTTFAANCNAFLIYLGFFYPSAKEGYTRIAIICLVVLIITIVNYIGVRESALMTNVFTIGKIVPLLIFAAVGVFFIEPANFNFAEAPEYGKFSAAVLLLIYAYVGFEAAVIPAGETKEPRRAVPFALLAALVFCAALFMIIQIVAIGTLPELAQSERPLADAAGKFMGSFGASFIVIGALVSILGNLNGGILTASRIPFAMAEQKVLPQFLAKTHPRFKTPSWAILLTSFVVLVLTIQFSFLTAVAIATITRLLVYATTCAALPVFRWRQNLPKAKFLVPAGIVAVILSLISIAWSVTNTEVPIETRILAPILSLILIWLPLSAGFRWREDVPPAEFHAPLGIVAAILSLLLIVWLLTNVDYKKEGLAILIAAAVGIIIYFGYQMFRSDK